MQRSKPLLVTDPTDMQRDRLALEGTGARMWLVTLSRDGSASPSYDVAYITRTMRSSNVRVSDPWHREAAVKPPGAEKQTRHRRRCGPCCFWCVMADAHLALEKGETDVQPT